MKVNVDSIVSKKLLIYQQVALSICPDHANKRQCKTAIEKSSQTEIMPPLQSDDFRISIEADNFLHLCCWYDSVQFSLGKSMMMQM